MRVVLAFDKFKGSATSQQLNDAAFDALAALQGVTACRVPVADGGDGTTVVLASACRGQWVSMPTMGPLLQLPPVNASYFMCDDGTALIEVAAASGLSLLADAQRDVMRASTYGTGLVMRDAMERGSRHIVLGLGGSATCDAAMGILSALGAEFLDADSRYLFPCGESLGKIEHIGTAGLPQAVRDCRFTLLTDVDNTLCGVVARRVSLLRKRGQHPPRSSSWNRPWSMSPPSWARTSHLCRVAVLPAESRR